MTSRGSLSAANRFRTSSSRRNCSGPAISTVPFAGGPTAILPTALATSSAAIRWKSTGGKHTLLTSGGKTAKALQKFKNFGGIKVGEGVEDYLFKFSLAMLVRE